MGIVGLRTELISDAVLPMIFSGGLGRGLIRHSRGGISGPYGTALDSFDWKLLEALDSQKKYGVNYRPGEYNVFHSVTSPYVAQSKLVKIDQARFEENSRFGPAFYVSEIPDTTLYELKSKNAQATHTIRYCESLST